jgi:L-ascorbate metabolism protein UlaG (beta-lactamase superfamily)
MRIRWFGQSAFLLTGSRRVAIDPFPDIRESLAERGRRFDYPKIEGVDADVLMVTHEHLDHNGVEAIGGDPHTVRSVAGTYETPIGGVRAIASEHDDAAGTKRGPNAIVTFALDGLRLCHFGDFGQPALRREQREAIGTVDVLMLPIGGGPTIGGAAAAAVVRELAPRLVVPMHYRTPAVTSSIRPTRSSRSSAATSASSTAPRPTSRTCSATTAGRRSPCSRRLREGADVGAGERDEVGRRDLDLQAAAARAHMDRGVRERALVHERVELPALPERADAARDVAGDALRARRGCELGALAERAQVELLTGRDDADDERVAERHDERLEHPRRVEVERGRRLQRIRLRARVVRVLVHRERDPGGARRARGRCLARRHQPGVTTYWRR